jgi:hypothetical protein
VPTRWDRERKKEKGKGCVRDWTEEEHTQRKGVRERERGRGKVTYRGSRHVERKL